MHMSSVYAYSVSPGGQIAKNMSADIETYPKEVPPDGLLLWKFVGYNNVILSNGAAWKRHSKIIKAALDRNLPVEEFGLLARKLFKQMGSGGPLRWDDLTMRYTLDAVGQCISVRRMESNPDYLYCRNDCAGT